MAKLVVLYGKPKDPAAFRDYYMNKHVPIVKQIAGIQAFTISEGPVNTPQGPASYHMVATLTAESLPALMQGLGSPEGQRAAQDVPNFADGGAELLIFDEQRII
ncbi:MAG: ethD like-protein [Burkholderiales bacterium 66-5]|nr:MAG: ethD like-protein [Burkholderiales bacterium 66-5]